MEADSKPPAASSWFRRVARRLSGNVLPKWAYPVVSGPLKGSRFILGSAAGEGGGASIYFNLVEPAKTQAFMNLLASGQVVFDIGANIGYYTVLSSKLVGPYGQVVAFEPALRNLVYLYQHLKLNRADNVRIISAACSDQFSLAQFSYGASWAMGHLQPEIAARSQHSQAEAWVTTITIDEVVRVFGQIPDVMKIDVEGAELNVLQGASETLAQRKPRLLLAVHHATLRAECTDYLGQFGYITQVVADDGNGDVELLADASP